MSQKIAIFDIDGTLFKWQLYHELAFELKNQGKLSKRSSDKLDQGLANWKDSKTKWLNYDLAVVDVLNTELKGLLITDVKHAAQEVLSRKSHRVYTYTYNLVKELKAKGYYLLAVTGSQQEIAAPFAKQYGFDDCIGVLLERDINNKYTGKLARAVYYDKDKLIKEHLRGKAITLEGSIAIGDSGSDIVMLKMVDNPIAFNPSSDLYQTAKDNDWPIIIERKDLAYELNPINNEYALKKVTVL